jgi:hypothetical protein
VPGNNTNQMGCIEYINWLADMDAEVDYSNIQEPVTVDFVVEEEYIFDNDEFEF